MLIATLSRSLTKTSSSILVFLPKLIAFIVILIIGYFVSKLLAKVVDKVLERVGFDRIVERGGIRKALSKFKYDASAILGQIVFYAVFLFFLELAFGIFGPNPISNLLTRLVAFLPKIFVAVMIVVIAAAIGAAVKAIIEETLGGLSYGSILAKLASSAIVLIGVFAALDQLAIAPAIVNGLFYFILVVVGGSVIVAVGGSGIQPLRQYWEQYLQKMAQETKNIKNQSQEAPRRTEQREQVAKTQAIPAQPGPHPTTENPTVATE